MAVLKPRPPNHSPPLRLVKAGCEQRKRKHQELQQMEGEPAKEEEEEEEVEEEEEEGEEEVEEVLKKQMEREHTIEQMETWEEEQVLEEMGDGEDKEAEVAEEVEQSEAMDASEELAHDWDSEDTGRRYTQEEFLRYYGVVDGQKQWETAKYATDQAVYAVEEMSKDRQIERLVKLLLPAWMNRPDGELAPETFRAFYVPLRWRAEYLQKHCVPPGDWTSYNLSGATVHTWKHFNAFIAQSFRITGGRKEQQKIRSTFELCVRRFAKSARLAKEIMSSGLASVIHVHRDTVHVR